MGSSGRWLMRSEKLAYLIIVMRPWLIPSEVQISTTGVGVMEENMIRRL